MKISILDANTLGDDISLKPIEELGICNIYPSTSPAEVAQRISDSDVVVINKVKLNESNLKDANNLKLICLLATGYDNVDTDYCRNHGIAVCNVEGYSSHSVAQLTVATVLSLATHLGTYTEYVRDGSYTRSGVANCLTPVYHELWGKIWGIVGFGNIGREVGRIAEAFGCKVIVNKRTPVADYQTVDIDTLCRESDIITLHTPLNDTTHHLIDENRLSLMKKGVIIVNAARGAVTDEEAVAKAVENGIIGAFGTDVYSVEPMPETHPLYRIRQYPNVILTPHTAWGARESRERCIYEVSLNIKAFFEGEIRNRLDIFI